MKEPDGAFITRCDLEIRRLLKEGAHYWRAEREDAMRLARLAGRVHWFHSYPTASVAIGLAEDLVYQATQRLLDRITNRVQGS